MLALLWLTYALTAHVTLYIFLVVVSAHGKAEVGAFFIFPNWFGNEET